MDSRGIARKWLRDNQMPATLKEYDSLAEILDQHAAEAIHVYAHQAKSRRTELLQAAYTLLRKCAKGPYVKNALEETVFYDGTDCDGTCLMEDIMCELDLPDPYQEKEDE